MIYARRDIASKTTKGPLLPIAGDQRIVDYRYIDDRVFMPKRKLIPLPSAAFQILLALAGEDLHGYGIMRQVAEQTHGRMRLGPGTLYSSIQTLVDAKLIEETEPREDVKLDRKSTRLNSSHVAISYAVFCLKKK